MKKIVNLLVLLVLVSCTKNKNQTEKNEFQNKEEGLNKYDIIEEKQDKDTIKNYWSIDLDTIKSTEIVKNDKENFKIEILNYSLNDSSIVKNSGMDSYHINLDIYHDRVSEIAIRTGSGNVAIKTIDKASFKIKDEEFNKYSVIKYTKFVKEKDGELFFISTLNIPDTDWVENIKFSMQKENPNNIKLSQN